jgi:hypothetical protein
VGYGYRYDEVDLTLPEVKQDLKLTVPRDVDPSVRPPVKVSLGCHVDGVAMPRPDLSDPHTMVAGVCKRFATKVPEAKQDLRVEFRAFVRHYIRENYVPLAPDADTSVQAWLAGTNYPEWRKNELRAKLDATDDLRDPKLYECSSFMKDEDYLEFKHGRGINSRSDQFKCLVGPIFKLIEEVVYKDHHFIKHVPVAKRPEYIRDLLLAEGVRYFASDYTAFEALFVRELMEACEFELYLFMTEHLSEFQWFKSICEEVLAGENICNFKTFKVVLQAVRMSGEMCTSLGNGFTNLMAMLFVCQRKGSSYVEGVVEGDDGLFAINGPPPSAEDFAELGLVIKLEEHDNISSASFCGLVFDPTDLVNIADPRKILAGFGWTCGKYSNAKPKILSSLLRCKALSLAYQYPGAPVLQALAKYGLRVTDDTRTCKMLRAVNGRSAFDEWHRRQILEAIAYGVPVFREVPIRTRLLMEEKFGLSVADQLRIEAYLDSLDTVQPLKIDEYLFPVQWAEYWARYVQVLPADCRHPEIAIRKNGLSIYSLFSYERGWLVPVQRAPQRKA